MKYKWTYETCFEEAKKYKGRYEFQKGSKSAYHKSLSMGWINDYIWLKTPILGANDPNIKNHCVYSYVDNGSHSIYVGRTNNIQVRHKSHNKKEYKTGKYDTVKQFFINIGKELPLPDILSENLTLEESQEQEHFFLNKFKKEGWHIINKGKTGKGIGSIGCYAKKLTYDYCKDIALKCNTRKEFERKNGSAYAKSRKMGWIDEFIPNKIHICRTYEECLAVAKKFTTNRDFRKYEPKIYRYAQRHDWLESFTWLKRDVCKTFIKKYKITKEEVIEAAKTVIYRNEFKKKYPSLYRAAIRNGWIEDLHFQKWQKYSYYEWCLIAKKFKSKQKFRKQYPELVQQGYKYKWFEKSNLFENKTRKLTKEYCLKIANIYGTIKELRDHDESVYSKLLKEGWLKNTKLKHIRSIKSKNMIIEFYKENLDFPISGCDGCCFNYKKTINRIYNMLFKFINKKTNIKINFNDRHKIFISNFIHFCKEEGIDYRNILQIEVLQNNDNFKIIVSNGIDENVQILGI